MEGKQQSYRGLAGKVGVGAAKRIVSWFLVVLLPFIPYSCQTVVRVTNDEAMEKFHQQVATSHRWHVARSSDSSESITHPIFNESDSMMHVTSHHLLESLMDPIRCQT